VDRLFKAHKTTIHETTRNNTKSTTGRAIPELADKSALISRYCLEQSLRKGREREEAQTVLRRLEDKKNEASESKANFVPSCLRVLMAENLA